MLIPPRCPADLEIENFSDRISPEDSPLGVYELLLDEDANLPDQLRSMEHEGRRLLRNSEPAFHKKRNRLCLTSAGQSLLRISGIDIPMKRLESLENIELSPRVRLIKTFLEEIESLGIPLKILIKNPRWGVEDGRTYGEIVQEYLDRLRQRARSKVVRTEMKIWESRQSKLMGTIVRLFSRMIAMFPFVTIWRIDLTYRKDARKHLNPLHVAQHLDRMQRNKRHASSVFDPNMAIIVAIEYGTKSGFHAHAIVMQGNEQPLPERKIIEIGDRICDYWRDVVTRGEGTFWLGNREKHPDEKDGLGNIGQSDFVKQQKFLKFVAPYLTKPSNGWRTAPRYGLKWPRLFRATNIKNNEGH